ncbi:MAG: tetratricopeptide repeat protein, partial [Petrimonas sp.]|nr:tetratricopeptide repeat protein [Petrimonas sp.]
NVVLNEHPDFFTGYYMRAEMKRQLNDLRGAEHDYLAARNEEAKAKKQATTDAADGRKRASESKDTREETDKDIDKFNLLVVADKEASQKSQSKYQRESRGRVQDLNTKVTLEPKFVLTYYDKGFEVNRPVYFSKSMEKANRMLNLNWKLKAVNNEAPLNEMQVQTHFRSIDNFSRLLVQRPNDAKLYFGRGMDFMLVQDYENALKDINKAIELQPDFLQPYFVRAVIMSKQLELDPLLPPEAVTQESPVGVSPADRLKELPGIARAKIPEVSTKSFRYDAILKDYETVLRLDPDFIFAYYNMAEIYSLEKDYRAAIDSYSKALKLEPQFAEAYFNRGLSRLSIGETALGLDDLRKAGELGIVESYSIIKRMQ